MATSNDRLRARYGICLSDSCQKCKDKTVQIITGRQRLRLRGMWQTSA